MAYGHGKVILFGEHSVVYGRPALALAVERGAEASGTIQNDGPTTLHIAPWGVDVDTGAAPNVGREPLQEALRVARAFYGDAQFALTATVRLPSGAGMGSSAALGVAVLRAMDEARGVTQSDEEIFKRSLAWENVFHGTASGVDNAMATYGGLALFAKGPPLKLTRIVPRERVRLIAGDSGSPGNTKDMVASVRRQFDKDELGMNKQFDAISAIVTNGKSAVETGDMKSLGQLMDMNHMLLAGMMLSTGPIEDMIAAAKKAGALGAKVTGAGGGGCMIALVDSDETHAAVKAALLGLGKTVYEVEARGSAREREVESGA